MSYRWVRVLLPLAVLLAFTLPSPAPLIYTPGQGWSYEPVGSSGKWQRTRAKDQLDVAQAAFDKKDYGLALRAARRVVRVWPLSDYAPQAQYLVGRCYEARGQDEEAFKEYQKVLQNQPKTTNYEAILQRQYAIANRYFAGKWFKLWGYIPIFPSMDKTADMYDKIVKNGPFSDYGPKAQMQIGAAREKQKDYPMAAKAYETAADRYHDLPKVAADALFREGMAYRKEAQTAEYDQSTAGQAIATLTDFMTLYPNDSRVPQAQKIIDSLKGEQARGNFEIAKFYEKSKRWSGALVYYNEVILKSPDSPYAAIARQRIDTLKRHLEQAKNTATAPNAPKK